MTTMMTMTSAQYGVGKCHKDKCSVKAP